MKIFISRMLQFAILAQSALVHAGDQAAPKSIAEYFKNNKLITERRPFYNADATQRVEYYCEDENLPGGGNEGASNPANVHCTAALFIKRSGKWIFSDRVDLRYGSVQTFTGHKLIAEMLEYGASDALCCPSEKTTLVFNTKTGKFVEDIAAEGKPALVYAIEKDAKPNQIAEMIRRGADVNAQDAKGRTPLMIALRRDNVNVDTVQLLLDHNADVNAMPEDGTTALISATLGNNISIVRLLPEKGADVNAKQKDGRTALIYAASIDIIKLLLDKGADVKAKAQDGWPALPHAITDGKVDVVRLLLEKGAEVNEQYGNGLTPLILAVSNGKVEMVRLLLDKGADVNLPGAGSKTRTPLTIASERGRAEIVKLLLDRGAK